jgi:hypothetical protein
MWVDREQAQCGVHDLTNRIALSDLTDLELLALIALLEPADERVNRQTAPVLKLAPKLSRRRAANSPKSAS